MFQITQAINITGQQLDCIVLSRSNQMMFLAAHNGSVLSVKFPLQEPVHYTDHNMHSHPITRVSSSKWVAVPALVWANSSLLGEYSLLGCEAVQIRKWSPVLQVIFSRSLLFHPDDGGSRIFQDIGTYLPHYMVSHVRRHSTVRTSNHTKSKRMILFRWWNKEASDAVGYKCEKEERNDFWSENLNGRDLFSDLGSAVRRQLLWNSSYGPKRGFCDCYNKFIVP